MAQFESQQVAPATAEDLLCPLCDYDLRGLVDPRCPECGYTFEWDELRDPAQRKHRYLFEHHPERNVQSFLRTMIGGLLPRRFWTGLRPSQPSRPRRLATYALVIALAALLPLLLCAVREISLSWAGASTTRSQWAAYLQTAPGVAMAQGRYPGLTTTQILDIVAPRPTLGFILRQRHAVMLLRYLAIAQSIPILWIAFTLATLTILQVSLRRARLRQIHLVRCVVYCADVFVWNQLFTSAAMLVFIVKAINATRISQIGAWWWNDDRFMLSLFAWSFAALLPVFCYRLIIAFKKYLQFDHPISTILLTQVVVLLAMALVLIFTVGWVA